MSHLTLQEMTHVVGRIIELDRTLKPLLMRSADDYRIEPGPPAIPANIDRLRAALPFRLPPSYVQLLGINDGVLNFYWTEGELHSTSDILKFPNYAKEYDLPDYFLFITATSWVSVGFDKRTQDPDGEMEVVEFDNTGELDCYPSLSAFLIAYRDRLEGWLKEEQADRAAAKSDDD